MIDHVLHMVPLCVFFTEDTDVIAEAQVGAGALEDIILIPVHALALAPTLVPVLALAPILARPGDLKCILIIVMSLDTCYSKI